MWWRTNAPKFTCPHVNFAMPRDSDGDVFPFSCSCFSQQIQPMPHVPVFESTRSSSHASAVPVSSSSSTIGSLFCHFRGYANTSNAYSHRPCKPSRVHGFPLPCHAEWSGRKIANAEACFVLRTSSTISSESESMRAGARRQRLTIWTKRRLLGQLGTPQSAPIACKWRSWGTPPDWPTI